MFVWVYLGLSTAVNCYQTATKPATLWPQIAQKPWSEGAPGRFRTCDPPLRRRPLYPLSYGGH